MSVMTAVKNAGKAIRRALWREKVETTLQADRFDLLDWREAGKAIPMLVDADEAAGKEFCGHPVQDGFFSLFKASPQLQDPPPTGLAPLSDLLRRGMETPNWQRLHDTARGDVVAAGVAAHAFVQETLKNLPEEVKEKARTAQAQQDEADHMDEQVANLEGLLEALKERQADAEGMPEEEVAALEEQIAHVESLASMAGQMAEESRKDAEAALAGYRAAAEANAPGIAAAMNHAAGDAQAQAQEASETVRGFSLAAGGDGTRVDASTAHAAMQVLKKNPNLKKLAEMLGWARRTVRAEWRKSPRSGTEMVGYRTHELQPEKMAASEMTALVAGDEVMALDWMRRAVDGGINHRHYEGKEKQGRGPLVIVRDESGSMYGTPHALAVALEWALLEIARRDGRDFYSVPFSGAGEFHVWEAPKVGKPDGASLVRHLEHFYNGGTEPYQPIMAALKLIEGGDLRADVLVLTDSAFASPPEPFLSTLKAKRKERPLKVVAVVVGGSGYAAEQFADRVVTLGSLLGDREKLRGAVAEVV